MLYIVLAIFDGWVATMSRLVNSSLGSYVGSLKGSCINHVVGTVFAGLLLLLGVGSGQLQFEGIPIYYFIGGMLGVFLVTFNNAAVPVIGAAAVAILMLFAQLLTSSIIDQFGLFGAQVLPMTPLKCAGLALLVVGSCLVMQGKVASA
jgi:bacterial/archaeal transporter family-2 protein